MRQLTFEENWELYIATMMIAFPLILTAFNVFLFTRIIPEQIIRDYVVLSYEYPNFFAMYLTNFAHITMMHLLENLLGYLVTMVFIFVTARWAIPAYNRRTHGLRFHFSIETLWWSTLVFLTVIPFLISWESILVGPIFGVVGGLGFSAIEYAFIGYLIYVIDSLILRKVIVVSKQGKRSVAYLGLIIAVLIPLSIILGQYPFPSDGFPVDYPGHLTGFLLGIIVPLVIDFFGEIETNMRTNQRVVVKGKSEEDV